MKRTMQIGCCCQQQTQHLRGVDSTTITEAVLDRLSSLDVEISAGAAASTVSAPRR